MILINVKFDIFILSYFIVLSAVLVKALFEVSLRLSSAKSSNVEKNSAYECGYDPFSLNIGMFDPQFYIVGILFIIFDLELMFLYPWAFYLSVSTFTGLYAMWYFLLVLTTGFVYEWQKGALDWSKSTVLSKEFKN